MSDNSDRRTADNSLQRSTDTDSQPPTNRAEFLTALQDFSKYFRSEALVTDSDLRVDVANSLTRAILGNEAVHTVTHETHFRGNFTQIAGERDRTVGSYKRNTDNSEDFIIENSYKETVNGKMTVNAKLSAEAMVGGTYTNIITDSYVRIAAWCDFLAWGGWLEADVIRTEIAAAMFRSYIAYAHATTLRLTLAGRMVDDYVHRIDKNVFDSRMSDITLDANCPGGGVNNDA